MAPTAFDFEGWTNHEPPADPAEIAALRTDSGIELPEDYLDLLRLSNGGGGPLDVEPGWFQIWPAGDVLPLNRNHEVQQSIPGLIGFGSNGGGELLAFDTRGNPPWKIVMVPFLALQDEAIVWVAKDFARFLMATGRATPRD
ncbi:SMI1/KNR4 family protein [Isosphaeraceae bacterium EP7]